MQIVLPWNKGIAEYQTGFGDISPEHPQRCVRCGCAKFHKWGKYMRNVTEEHRDHLISIRRIRCVKCGQTHSYLPSFCMSRCGLCADLLMALLNALIRKIRVCLEDRRRRAYALLRRFRDSESLWLTYLRARGFSDFPADKQERTAKIFSSLLELHRLGNLFSDFFEETRRHFMSVK